MNDLSRANEKDGPRDVVVMKFGGTSVGDAPAFRRLLSIVKSRMHARPVVVVSALAKVTDQLLSAAQVAAEGKLEYANAVCMEIRLRHQEIAAELLNADAYAVVDHEFSAEFHELNAKICETAVAGHLTPRAQDAILGFGERLSSKLVHAVLRLHGVDAVHLDAASAIITDSRHTQATPQWDLSYLNLANVLEPLLRKDRIPVLGGFIASDRDGVPTTLGRGGSDLTASIVGAALHATRIEIWTDVDGIMTTDPNVCPEARRIPRMSFEDAATLAHFGAKVLHPATLKPAMEANIPVHVLNSRNPDGEGTEIMANVSGLGSVRALTAKRGIAAVEVDLREGRSAELITALCAVFERHHCAIDVMAASHDRLSLLVGSTSALPAVAAEAGALASLKWENHKALVCLVGENLHRQPDVVSRVFAAVSDMDVRVLCQGGSDRALSFLVEETKAEESMRRLHALFFSDRKQPVPTKFNSAALCQAGESWL
ncbi:MAG TPA: aspartate kinase [Terriglobales bacterium]|nr:aspartate kinase [Terriglobales bacterium]